MTHENIIKNFLNNVINNDIRGLQVADELIEYVFNQYYKLVLTKNIIFRSEPIDFINSFIPLTLQFKNKYIRLSEPKKFLAEYKHIGILGSAGSGKTTLLKYMAIKSIDEGIGIPVVVELRNYNFKNSFEDFVAEHISTKYLTDVKKLFKSGRFVFILDGYDEIDYLKGISFIRQIDEFVSKNSGNIFIISSRPGTNIESLSPFYIFSVCPLNEDDIFLFVNRLDVLPSYLRKNIIESIHSDISFKDVLSIPLFLSLYIVVYRSGNHESLNNRSVFFRNIIDLLFAQHDSASKLGYVREKISNLTIDELEKVSTVLAFRIFFSSKLLISKDTLYQEFEVIKKSFSLKFENDKLLYDLSITVNILIESNRHYLFHHLLILEYLTCLFISKLEEKDKENFYKRIVQKENLVISISFLNFLIELDFHFFIKCFLIPKLEQIREEAFYMGRVEQTYSSNHIFSVIHSFLKTNYYMITIFKSVTSLSFRTADELITILNSNISPKYSDGTDPLFDVLN